MDECIFCRIARGEARASVVARSSRAMAFMDIAPVAAGHVLIIPTAHVADIYELSDEDAVAVMQMAVRVARALWAVFAPAGLNLISSNGRAAGQDVFHFHLHLVPRVPGDGIRFRWPHSDRPDRDELDALAREIRSHLEIAS